MKKLITLIFLILWQPVLAEEGPQQLIESASERVLTALQENTETYRADPSLLNALVDEVVLPHFDFDAMTQLALGRYRKKVSDEQRPAIVNEFRQLLIRTYGSALLEYNDEKLIYLPMEGSEADGKVVVRTEVQQEGGFPIPISYKMRKRDDGWKVYDISVDEVSLVTNYRSSFGRTIKKSGVEGLLQVLKERNASQ